MTTTHDYYIENEHGENTMVCNDCNTPAYYDRADEQYHHAVAANERACFLIGFEDRPDDIEHPLYAAYTTFRETLAYTCDEYAAKIESNTLDTLFRLNWTDGVTGEWTEHYYTLAAALIRLGALDFCKGGEIFFLTDDAQFNAQAHTFLGTVTS